MVIETTDDLREQAAIGKEILRERPEVYTREVTDEIYSIIRSYGVPDSFTAEDIFFISLYNYWRYGFVTKEVFYFDLLHKKHEEKETYISNMNKLNYTRHLNKREKEYLMADKYETYQILKDHYGRELIRVSPRTGGSQGTDLSGTGDGLPEASSIEGYDQFRDFFGRHSEFVVKPVGLATSIGVRKCSVTDFGNDPDAALKTLLRETEEIQSHYRWARGRGIIVEEVIRQGEALAGLHPASVNSVRITTVRADDSIHFFYPVIRIGKGGNFLCSRSSGSIVAGINSETGIVETDGFTDQKEYYICHPDTGIRMKGFRVPKWDEVCRLAVEAAMRFEDLGYIGWDFAYTEDEKWIIVEGNENGGFVGQIPYQRGLLKEFTDLIHWKSEKKYWWIGRYPEI